MIEQNRKTILDNVNDRFFSNPVYFLLLVTWCLVHWRFFVAMFFVSEENIPLDFATKDLYLKALLFDTEHHLISILVLLSPLILVLFVLYVVQPYLLPALLRKHISYERQKIDIETGVEQQKKKLLIEKEENLNKEESIDEKVSANYLEEYNKFIQSDLILEFDKIITSIYQKKGQASWIEWENGVQTETGISTRALAYFNTSGVIDFDSLGSREISLTPKGNFFVTKFLQEKG